MAHRRSQSGGRRMDYSRNDFSRNDFRRDDRNKSFSGRSGVSPWQGSGPGSGGLPNLLPLGGGSTEATLALASNIINLLQPRQNTVPSLLDMPIRRDFGPNLGRFDRGYGHNRMGNQGNFRRTGNYNRAGERIHTTRKPFRPNDGQRQQNRTTPRKEADSKAKPVKESEQEEKTEQAPTEPTEKTGEGEVRSDAPKTRYDDINPELLKCHICNKSMWDGRSFENHLNGRAHAIMMQKTAESYALTADTMRSEFKIREMKRSRKTGGSMSRDFYCAMCDMYAADGAIHRTNVCHRKLKKYLHPTCTSCRLEMPNRIELDEHRLTADHLRNLQDKQGTVTKPKPEVMVISTLSMEQSYLRNDRHRWRHGDRDRKRVKEDSESMETQNEQTEGDQNETDQVVIKKEKDADEPKEGTEENEEEKKKEEQKDNTLDHENTVLDYQEGDDLSQVTRDMYPAYSTERGVGASFLREFRCVQCTLCHKLLDTEETAQVHLRTWRHHQLFLRLLAGRPQEANQQENAESTDAQPATVKRSASAEEQDGNWKRRKTGDEDQNGHHDENDKDGQTNEADHSAGDMPGADDLEDWEQSVDEILDDEKTNGNNQEEEAMEQQPEPEAEPEPETAPEPEPAPEPQPTPKRTAYRGRGRARGRGRY